MSQPKWITPAGNLGIVPSLEYYQFTLDAYDATGGTLVYTRVSGRLPPGIQVVNTGKLQGIPVSEAGPDANTTYTFTIRATNSSSGSVTDRTFTLTITNVSPPIIIPKDVDLGVFFDGDIVNIQFQALEFIVEDNLTWSVVDGEIPEGLTLSQSGQLTGYIKQIAPNPMSQWLNRRFRNGYSCPL
jgi:archaellum component FlaG (FlaF/FlaG flagellin family)